MEVARSFPNYEHYTLPYDHHVMPQQPTAQLPLPDKQHPPLWEQSLLPSPPLPLMVGRDEGEREGLEDLEAMVEETVKEVVEEVVEEAVE